MRSVELEERVVVGGEFGELMAKREFLGMEFAGSGATASGRLAW